MLRRCRDTPQGEGWGLGTARRARAVPRTARPVTGMGRPPAWQRAVLVFTQGALRGHAVTQLLGIGGVRSP
jgi:hypothetical protein